ncbi:uncharacterized protein [Dysidea avara]|uniref:uncharacterized protein n=1 Tax=Dysidea avara TaxID=196820 RepID=UPI00332D6E92
MSSETKYKLYAKASPDGKGLGDCPFTQRANLALTIKGVTPEYIYIDLHNKPDWFFQINPEGSVPVLDTGDRKITQSAEIVIFAEEKYPNPTLRQPGNDKAMEVSQNIFNVFGAWAKNKEESKTGELKQAFIAELSKINDYLVSNGGPMLCGKEWSISDCHFAPRIYHIQAVAKHYLKYNGVGEMPGIKAYMDFVFNSEPFKRTGYPEEYILEGWAKYFS